MAEEIKFHLVEFITRGPKKPIKQIDIVPSSWISFNKLKGKLECQFLPPPYTKKSTEFLHDLVSRCQDVPSDWPYFTVDVKGVASKLSAISS